MAKTTSEIITDLKKRIAFSNPQMDLTSGNVVTDLGVEAFATEMAAEYAEAERIKGVYINNSSSFTEQEADQLANSHSLYRLEATKATGEVTFCTTSLPSSGSSYTIPIGTVVSTSDDTANSKSYITTTEGVIDSNTALNPFTNYYEVVVNIEAITPGSEYNVGPGSINKIVSAVEGVSIVYNPNAVVNGTDTETKEELLSRVILKLAGSVYGTKKSLLSKTLEDPRVIDALVVDPNNEFSTRGPGTVDIYILGSQISSYTQTVTEKNSSVYLIKTPVLANGTSVVTFDDGTIVTEGNGYAIVQDDMTDVARSYKAKDKLVWDESYFTQIVMTKNWYTITYSYNKLVSDIQETLNSDDFRIVTADILIKTTQQLDVSMDFDLVTLPGYDSTIVRDNVVYAIQDFVNNFKLDQDLRQSDIIAIVEAVDGVDYIKLPFRQFNLKGVSGVSDVNSSPLEYIRIDSSDILIG